MFICVFPETNAIELDGARRLIAFKLNETDNNSIKIFPYSHKWLLSAQPNVRHGHEFRRLFMQ